jgi:hypothetical protein
VFDLRTVRSISIIDLENSGPNGTSNSNSYSIEARNFQIGNLSAEDGISARNLPARNHSQEFLGGVLVTYGLQFRMNVLKPRKLIIWPETRDMLGALAITMTEMHQCSRRHYHLKSTSQSGGQVNCGIPMKSKNDGE